MDDSERLESLIGIIDDINSMECTHTILVEGVNDVSSLEASGVRGTFYCVQSGGGPVKAAEHVWKAGRSAIIMTDWDRRGDSLAESLSENLSSLDVRFDRDLRRRMAYVCRPFCKDVESVHSVLALLESRTSTDKINTRARTFRD